MLDGMTNIKASEVLKELKRYTEDLPHYSPDEVAETLELAIKALEQQPTDAVSRDDVDSYIAKLMSGYLYDEERTRLEEFSAYLWELPSVTPERPKGTWKVFTDINADRRYSCSICNNYIIKFREDKREFNYCPYCGAEMEGEE